MLTQGRQIEHTRVANLQNRTWLLPQCLSGLLRGAGESGRALSSLEVSGTVGHLSCREKSMSGLAQGRGFLKEHPGRGGRKYFEEEESI